MPPALATLGALGAAPVAVTQDRSPGPSADLIAGLYFSNRPSLNGPHLHLRYLFPLRAGVPLAGGIRLAFRDDQEYYISRVEASPFDPGTAYASADGHRHDDLRPYVWVTRDYGATWTSITSNLPASGNVNTIRQDPKNRSLLYLGTEFAFYASLDEGKTWQRFMNNLPTTRFDDIVVHPRDHDLVLATHGRGIWIMDDVTPLQQLTPEVQAADAHLFTPRSAVRWRNDPTRSRSVTGSKNFRGDNAPPGTGISYYLKSAAAGDVKITIANAATGELFRNLDGTKEQGINSVQWNLRGNPPPRPAGQIAGGGGGGGGGGFGGQQQGPLAQPGIYRVTLTVGGRDYTRMVEVEEDRWLTER